MTQSQRLAAAVVGALLSALVAVATLIEPQWFERLTGLVPDDGDGLLETVLTVTVAGLFFVGFAALAAREWLLARRARRELAGPLGSTSA